MGLWPTHRKHEKALRPLTPTLSPVGGDGVSALISWFLLATDYWQFFGTVSTTEVAAQIIKARTAEGGGST